MTLKQEHGFWHTLARLAVSAPIVIDRPRGSQHPARPELEYPLDYGYLEGTNAGDGNGIDVWLGILDPKALTGILCTYDTNKRDAEIKLMLGGSEEDVRTVPGFHDENLLTLYIENPAETS